MMFMTIPGFYIMLSSEGKQKQGMCYEASLLKAAADDQSDFQHAREQIFTGTIATSMDGLNNLFRVYGLRCRV